MVAVRDIRAGQIDAWPAVAYEDRPWKSRIVGAPPRGPYPAAVVPPIASLTDVPLTSEARALADAVSIEIVRFEALVAQKPPAYAELLLRLEATCSSRIEGYRASARNLGMAEVGADTDPDDGAAELTIANVEAMRVLNEAEHLGLDSILDAHRVLLQDSAPQHAGHWRDQPVWIGGGGGPHDALFVPPHAERVHLSMYDCVQFIDRPNTALPALVHAAVAHGQFETVHPFADGNGRTGRALIQAMFRASGLSATVVPLSAGLLADVFPYYDALTAYREGDPTQIVEVIAHAASSGIIRARRTFDALTALRACWDEDVTARPHAAVWRLADLLIARPVVDVTMISRQLRIPLNSALAAIERLVDSGVLVRVAGGQRYRKYAAEEALAIHDDFMARSGRNGRQGAYS